MDLPRHVVVVGALVRNEANEVLLIRHHRRGWEIPQGKVEEGEGLIEALHREVLEETGIEIEPGPLAAIFSKTTPPAAVIFNFLARHRAGEPKGCEECLEVGWYPPALAVEKVTGAVMRDRLRTLLDFSGAVVYRSYTPTPFVVHSESVLEYSSRTQDFRPASPSPAGRKPR